MDHEQDDDSSSEKSLDSNFSLDELQSAREAKDAHDYIIGEQDYDPDNLFNIKPWLRSKWKGFKRARMINLRIYKIKPAPFHEEASNALVNICRYRLVDINDVIDLLEMGASVNYHPKVVQRATTADPMNPLSGMINGATALHWCARRGHTHILWALLQPDVNADVNIVDNRNRTALMLACDTSSSDQVYFVRILLKHPKIRVNIRDAGGNTALLNAIYKGNVWIVRELLLFAPQTVVPAISVLEKQEIEDPNAYEIAQYIFCNGLLMNPIDMNPYLLEPALLNWKEGKLGHRMRAILYYLFSLKGYYKHSSLLYLQSIVCYDSELILRMVQRRSYVEGRRPHILVKKVVDFTTDDDDPDDEHIDMEDHSVDKKVINNRHKKMIQKYYGPKLIRPIKLKHAKETKEERANRQKQRRMKINMERGAARTAQELKQWNAKRKNNALKVNEEFDHRLRGNKSAPEFVKNTVTVDSAKSAGAVEGNLKQPAVVKPEYVPPKYFNYEDELHVRSKEWVRNDEDASNRDWKMQNRVSKHRPYSNVPALLPTKAPKDIKIEKHQREKFKRTNDGDVSNVYEVEDEVDSDEEVPNRAQEWKAATKTVQHREILHNELTGSNPHHFHTDEDEVDDDFGSSVSAKPVKPYSKPMVSLSKSIELARELRTNGTLNGVPVASVSNGEKASDRGARPATSADYGVTSVRQAAVTQPSIFDIEVPVVVPPTRTYKTSPKKFLRNEIGFVDTTSSYAKYKLDNIANSVSLEDMNRHDFENDDGYDEDES